MPPTETSPSRRELFWGASLSEIEESFLPEGKSILDLPVYESKIAPAQGNLWLNKCVILRNDGMEFSEVVTTKEHIR